MINKHSIYNWLFFPLFVSLLAGSVASCINDPAMEEDTSGKSTLSIMVRGVTTNPEQDGYDEYIKTLRIIGFDEKGVVVCNQQHSSTDFLIENGVLNITQTMEDAFQGGVCDFYFIANEETYAVSEETKLTDFLISDVLNKKNLEACAIATPSNQSFTPSEDTPILMTTSVRTTLRPGDNTINNIELVRCFAKLQLKIVNKSGEDISVTDPKVNGSYPNSYSLWNGSSSENWNQNDLHYEIDLNPLNQGSVTDDAQNYPLYYSTEVYFPERLFLDANNNNKGNAITFSFTLNNKTYNVEVADATGTDFNIRRNTHYTVIATLKKKETVTFNVMVNAWGEKTMDVPAFE